MALSVAAPCVAAIISPHSAGEPSFHPAASARHAAAGKWRDSQMTGTPVMPRVTAIVVGYNGAEDLRRALEALLASVDVSLDVV